jgi:DNA-binding GntR family transcriptional regulator
VANAFPDWMLYEAMFHHPELLTDSLIDDEKEHRAILDALAKGKPDAAAQKAVDHIVHLGTSLEELLDIPSELLREKERQVLPLIKQSK